MVSTTVRLDTKIKKELDLLKNFDKESYEDFIERLISCAKDEPALDDAEIKQIEKSLENIKKGRVLSLEGGAGNCKTNWRGQG